MRLELSLFAVSLLALIVFSGPTGVEASFWDSVPIASQVKSAFQAASGDNEGAKKTQENFVNRAPVVSQIKSAVQSARGDNEGAKKTQEEFLHEFVVPAADHAPVVGHIKGAVHIAQGDKEKGEKILKDSSWTTLAAINAARGGPVGAAVAGATLVLQKNP